MSVELLGQKGIFTPGLLNVFDLLMYTESLWEGLIAPVPIVIPRELCGVNTLMNIILWAMLHDLRGHLKL